MKKPKERRSGLAAGLLLLLLPGASPADPPVVAEWRAVPEFSDEFSGPVLDAAKWHATNPEWKGRKPGLFLPRNVRVKDGMLELTVKAETVPEMTAGYHSFTCASVKSMHRIRYGWFEIRARTGNSAASSAFWLYHQTPNLWTELDVFEITEKGKFRGKLHSNTPVLREPGLAEPLDFHEEWKLPWDPAAGFHRYALEWNASALRWYVDGKLVREAVNTHHKWPLHVMLDCETMPEWFGLPDRADLPAVFQVDYVRVWQRRGEP